MDYEQIQSKTINLLRFPLIVGVVFIHNYSPIVIINDVEFGNADYLFIYHTISKLFSQVVAGICVPLFFFISGFLFFRGVNFDKNIYFSKLKSRTKSLLIPYLFWNITCLVVFHVVAKIPTLSVWFNNLSNMYNLNYILTSLWTHPIVYQFWFIRDLMVVVLLTPLIYLYIKNLNIFGIVFFGLLWFFGFWSSAISAIGLSIVSLFFFSAGAWFGIKKKNIIKVFEKVSDQPYIYIIYIFIVVTDLCTKNSIINKLGILVGIICCFGIAGKLVKNNKVKISSFLTSASFFIFAIHEPWLVNTMRKILFKILQPEGDFMLTLLYFVIVALTVLIALVIYYIMDRYTPRFLSVISGGRKIN